MSGARKIVDSVPVEARLTKRLELTLALIVDESGTREKRVSHAFGGNWHERDVAELQEKLFDNLALVGRILGGVSLGVGSGFTTSVVKHTLFAKSRHNLVTRASIRAS